ncbi:MAG: mannose-6-phosphate isomerase, class I [Acidimicrobiales bacterium]
MYELQGVIRDYAWGDHRAIAELLGHAPPGHPEAEYWMGAHTSAPSVAVGPSGGGALDKLVDQDPVGMLGPPVCERFAKLPFLLKILAAEQPLSIQAHPSLAQAAAGFARENQAGIEISAANRSYRDDNHKPELICALTPFEAKCGFRSVAESVRLIELLDAEALAPLAKRLTVSEPDDALLAATIAWLLRLPAAEAAAMATGAVDAARSASAAVLAEFAAEVRWTVLLGESFPGDVGILVALLLNHVSLQPGEAIFLEAGNMHSYLHGVGVELMANSDNVLRGGLTPKHIDVEELLDVVDYQPSMPPVQRAEAAVYRFDVPVPEFGLTRVDSTVAPLGQLSFDVVGPEIILVTAGAVTLKGEAGMLQLSAGSVGFVAHADNSYQLIDDAPGETVAWRATVGTSFES